MYRRSLLWIRRDLRCSDSRAWSEAEALSEQIAVVFIFDKIILDQLKNKNDRRLTFIYDSLLEVQETLQSKGSDLIVRYGDPSEEIPKLLKELKADALFVNRDYEAYAKNRDLKVRRSVEEMGRHFYDFKDHVIFEAEEIKTKQETPFRVFTPYSKAWKLGLSKEHMEEAKVSLKKLLPRKEILSLAPHDHLKSAFKTTGFQKTELWLEAGRNAGLKKFQSFKKTISQYKNQRDFPSLQDGTSGLSVHLRFGTLSVRELLRASPGKDEGTQTWRNEIIWREFYHSLLTSFPEVSNKCFQSKYNDLEWPGSREHFKLWCEGQTGYPIVDAAMRHFHKTGWMHNRLRMIVASFLTKDLLCPWKWGEEYFAQNLLDYDFAANNGGWQWAASVGCDAQPYFRIFNPELQSERFDSKGVFIRSEIPELRDFPDKFIHAPWRSGIKTKYPSPIVEHKAQKEKVLKLFRSV